MKTKNDNILGELLPPPTDIMNEEVILCQSMYDKFARMNRVLNGWREGFNGKFDLSVNDENKEWLLALNEENNNLISYFEMVFESQK